MADIFSKEKRSEIMSGIRSKDTKAELLLRKALFAEGLRYRIHDKRVFGKPDIVFFNKKIAIFVDGDWWHGRNFEKENDKYPDFWKKKIMRNMERDLTVNDRLCKEGWIVFRFWQKDIEKKNCENILGIINKIKSLL